jgi:F0F1-type ATP synthase delta subunit
MQEQIESLARKYAQAYLHVYEQSCAKHHIDNLARFERFLKTHAFFFACLSIPTIKEAEKLIALKKTIDFFKLPDGFYTLCSMLLHRKRLDILCVIIKKIISYYQQQRNIMQFVVATSHDVAEQEKEFIQKFIKKWAQVTPVIKYVRDSSLLCGIKIKSETLLWERSLAKKLRMIQYRATI